MIKLIKFLSFVTAFIVGFFFNYDYWIPFIESNGYFQSLKGELSSEARLFGAIGFGILGCIIMQMIYYIVSIINSSISIWMYDNNLK